MLYFRQLIEHTPGSSGGRTKAASFIFCLELFLSSVCNFVNFLSRARWLRSPNEICAAWGRGDRVGSRPAKHPRLGRRHFGSGAAAPGERTAFLAEFVASVLSVYRYFGRRRLSRTLTATEALHCSRIRSRCRNHILLPYISGPTICASASNRFCSAKN